jgi:hypothetical protein
MYDTVYCEYDLPMPDDPKDFSGTRSFQTKDLGECLQQFTIKEDKSLWIHKQEIEYENGNPKGKTFLEKIGKIKVVKAWDEPHEITDTINIYDYIESDESDYDYFIEYRLVIEKGFVNEEKIVEFTSTPNAERKKSDKELKEEMQERYKFSQTFLYKYFYKHWNSFLWFSFSHVRSFLSFICSKSYKIENKLKI